MNLCQVSKRWVAACCKVLIVGAAKAGTSTLWSWLRQHPDIFMGDQKETHFLIYN